jgi:glycosyltransferase involved in cell wall biosynthesis
MDFLSVSDMQKPGHTPEEEYRLLFLASPSLGQQTSSLTNIMNIFNERFNMAHYDIYTKYKALGSQYLAADLLALAPNYDVFFIHFGKPILDFDFFRRLKKVNPKLAIVYVGTDADYYFPLYAQFIIDSVDLFLSLDSIRIADTVAQKNICSTVIGNITNKHDFHPLDGVTPDLDVSFYGGLKCDRKQQIDYLKNNDVNISCFGSSFGKYLSQEELNLVLNRSKIGISFNKFDVQPLKVKFPKDYPRATAITAHTFEYLLCGRFVLSEEIKNFERFLIPEKEVINFNGKKDLLDKIRYYLEHEQEREDIARAGHMKVMTYFEGGVVAKRMANLIIKKANEINGLTETYACGGPKYVNQAICTDSYNATRSFFVNFNTSNLLALFKKKKYKLALKELKCWKYGLPLLLIKREIYYLIFGFLGRSKIRLKNALSRRTN